MNPLSGWRLPTQTEWAAITTNTSARAGSTVNGSAGKHYALIRLTGVTHASSSTPNGLLIFPDGKSITGKTLSGIDNTTQTTGVTAAELNAYLRQGCVFFPASSYYYDGDGWNGGGRDGFYWYSTAYNSGDAYYLYFRGNYLNAVNYNEDYGGYYSVRLVRE